jgi:cephalosporin hydroxylase
MRIAPIIITCPQRAHMLTQTLANFGETDWLESPHIQMDDAHSEDRCARQTRNAERALHWFLRQTDAEFALLLEDDLAFNQHIHWNLERWSPVVDGRLWFGSLYNPNIRRLSDGHNYFLADPSACYGSQAYLLSREAVSVALQKWESVAGMQDIKLTRIISGVGQCLYYHQPSLVQHLGTESAWGGGFHQTTDFDRDWQAAFSYEQIPGWFTCPRLYEQAIQEANDGDVLIEVGVWLGRSTAFLCTKANASGKRIKVLIIDPFDIIPEGLHMVPHPIAVTGSVRKVFERNMRLIGVRDNLEIHQTGSAETAKTVPDYSCSFIFIDANHSYDNVRDDIRAWRNKVRPGGMLAGHDCYTYPSVYQAVRDELGEQFTMTDENVWLHRHPIS